MVRGNEQRRPPPGLFRAMNLVVRPLLRSPLHRLTSRRLMLLSYVGPKSGKEYTFSLGYFDWNPGVLFSISARPWVSALATSPRTRVRLRGRWRDVDPDVAQDPERVADLLGEFATRNGAKAARGLFLGLPKDRQPTREELLAAAAKTSVVLFRLVTPPA